MKASPRSLSVMMSASVAFSRFRKWFQVSCLLIVLWCVTTVAEGQANATTSSSSNSTYRSRYFKAGQVRTQCRPTPALCEVRSMLLCGLGCIGLAQV
jgi:hypothetical protein